MSLAVPTNPVTLDIENFERLVMSSNNIYIEKIKDLSVDNKYTKWYLELVIESQKRSSDKKEARKILGYVEGHHILPRCLCLSKNEINDKNNIIFLTFREHFVAHRLLAKMFHGTATVRKMQSAISSFARNKNSRKINSRQYAITKLAAHLSQIGIPKSKESIEKQKIKQKGKSSFYDDNGNRFYLKVNNPIIHEKKLKGNQHKKTTVRDSKGNIFQVDVNDERLLSGELVGIRKGKATYVDSNNKKYDLESDSPLIEKFNLKHINFGRKIKMPPGVHSGEKNSMFGRKNEVCCFDLINKCFKRVEKSEFQSNSNLVGVNHIEAKEFRKRKGQ